MARFAALDGLRGICALMVALYHLPLACHLLASPPVREGYVFVDFFFVLSGFVIAHAYGAKLDGGRQLVDFLVRRIGRLWPLHIVVLTVLVGLDCVLYVLNLNVAGKPPFSGEHALDLLLPNALLFHSWGLGWLSWNTPSWSISAELLAYIVFGAVTLMLGKRSTWLAAIIVTVTWFFSLVLVRADLPLYGLLPGLRGTCDFFAGVLVYAAFTKTGRPDWTRAQGTWLETGAVAAVVCYLQFVSRMELTPWAMPIFVAAIYIFAAERGALSALLKSAPLQLLGIVSYSIYLTHSLVITGFYAAATAIGNLLHIDTFTDAKLLFPATFEHNTEWQVIDFGNVALNDLYGLLFLAALIGLSMFTYRTIELPGQRLFARLIPRRFAPAIRATAS
jgi:peptidoglycan/LPS O-acetylase OafA/YrhL